MAQSTHKYTMFNAFIHTLNTCKRIKASHPYNLCVNTKEIAFVLCMQYVCYFVDFTFYPLWNKHSFAEQNPNQLCVLCVCVYFRRERNTTTTMHYSTTIFSIIFHHHCHHHQLHHHHHYHHHYHHQTSRTVRFSN